MTEDYREQALAKLRAGKARLDFTKADGTKRIMIATLNSELIPIEIETDTLIWGKHDQIITVWDLDHNGWRAFNMDRLNECEAI